MKNALRCLFSLITIIATIHLATSTQAAERRLLINQDSDYFGYDYEIQQDVELEACKSACMADETCKAFTYNVAAGWCFLKSDVGELRAVSGAVSGRIISQSEFQKDNKAERLAELTFIPETFIDEARRFEGELRNISPVPHSRFVKILELASEAAGRRDFERALDYYRSAVGIEPERYDLWKLLTELSSKPTNTPATTLKRREERTSAAINTYLRSRSDGERATTLTVIASAFEDRQNWKTAIAAYQASLDLKKDTAIKARFESLYSRHGFRVTNHVVETEGTEPQVCVIFSEDLPEGTNVEPFISVRPDGNLAINTEDKRLCITGVENGGRYEITVRSGLSSADGDDLIKPVTLEIFVPDRPSAVRFEANAYVLPAGGEAAIPVVSVNTDIIEAEVFRVGDRQLAQAIRDRLFLAQLPDYRTDRIAEETGERVWNGTVEVAHALNREVTTAIPVSEIVPELKPGAYVITARAANAARERYWHNKATQWFVVTDLGLTTLSGSDGFHIFARSLTSGRTLSGVELRLVAKNNEILGQIRTDAGGYAVLPAGLAKGTGSLAPALLVAEGSGGDYNLIDLTRSPLDLTDRGVAGRPAPGPLDVFLTTERGIYRAGEQVHITALVRDGTATAVPDVPLTAIVRRPDGIEASRFALSDQGLGGTYSSYRLSNAAMRGTWALNVYTDVDADSLAEITFLVEDFVPERLDFDLEASVEKIDPASPGSVSLVARFLYGQPAGELAVEGDIVVKPVRNVAAFSQYQFGLESDGFDPRRGTLDGRQTDATGAVQLGLKLPANLPETSRLLEAAINVRVLDPGGKPVERSLALPIAGSASRIGIRPLFEDGVENNSPATFQVIAINADENRVSAGELSWELIRIVRRYQWYRANGRWDYEPIESRQRITGGKLNVSSDEPAHLVVTPEWGSHELVIRDANGAALPASVKFRAGWYVEAKTIDTPEALRLTFDQPRYKVGDTARVHIDARYPGIAHLMVLDNRLIASKLVDVPVGGTEIDLPVTTDWGPGAYVTAALYRPMDLMARRMPARSIGIGWAQVDPGDRKLKVSLETPENPRPRQPFVTRITLENMAQGEDAFVTVAAVNAGILNLTGYEPPAPDEWYFAQRRLGTEIRDIYGYLIDRMQGAKGVIRSGGDGPLARFYEGPPPSESLVALHSGIVAVDSDGTATIEFAMPDFNGTVRVMVMAWTRSAVGKMVKDVIVRDPVVIATSGPQFLAPGDQSRLHVDLATNDAGAGHAVLEVEGSNASLSVAESTVRRSLELEPGSRQQVLIPITAGSEGDGNLTVTLTLASGVKLEKSVTIPVRNNQPKSVKSSVISLVPGKVLRLGPEAYAGFVPDTASLFFSVNGAGRLNVPAILSELDLYPYGCTEQLTSRALPLLYLDKVALAAGLRGDPDARNRIQKAISAILANQSASGSFGLWSPGSGDLWLDAFVTDFLTRARHQGFSVPQLAFDQAIGNLKNQLAYAQDFEKGGQDIAYALYVLAANSRTSIGDLRYYSETRLESFTTALAKAQIAAALGLYGDKVGAENVYRRAVAHLTGSLDGRQWRSDYGSSLRDAAAIITLASETGSTAIDANGLLQRLDQEWASAQHLSTQELSWSLLAAHALIADAEKAGIAVDGVVAKSPLYQSFDKDDLARRPLIENRGTRPVDILLKIAGVSQVPEPASGNFYEITRSYFTLEGEPTDLATVPQGGRLVAVLTVTSMEGRAARLIVNDPLPAGLEIDNPHILRSGSITALDWLDLNAAPAHVEFRSDRFVAALDRKKSDPTRFQFAYLVRAVSPGNFAHPAAIVEDMYRPERRARTQSGAIEIVGPLR